MIPIPNRASSERPGRKRFRRWNFLFPVGLIVGALVALVVVPLVLQHRTGRVDAHRRETLQPARDLVNTVQLSLAREMGALRGFVISGDDAFLDRYEEALDDERRAYEELRRLVPRMSPEVAAAFGDLRGRASRWHGRATEAEILARQLVPQEFIERLPSEEVRFDETLEAAERLRDRIVDEVERDRLELQRVERASLIVTALLALLALVAALGALWLGRRLKSLATEAESRSDELERAIQDRSRLIRGITHDVKNPLAAALGHVQLLLGGIVDEPEGRRDSLKRSEMAIGDALGIIDDMLELSKAEAGALRLTRQPTDLAALVREMGEVQRDQALRADVGFEVETPETLPLLDTDGRRVKEIVRNMVSNAIKYTPEGGTVTVRARIQSRGPARDGDARGIAIDVIDTGPGILPEERELVFQEFSRLRSGEDDADGTGLGLAISRQVARLLGGDLGVESEVGRGSTFTVWLPL